MYDFHTVNMGKFSQTSKSRQPLYGHQRKKRKRETERKKSSKRCRETAKLTKEQKRETGSQIVCAKTTLSLAKPQQPVRKFVRFGTPTKPRRFLRITGEQMEKLRHRGQLFPARYNSVCGYCKRPTKTGHLLEVVKTPSGR